MSVFVRALAILTTLMALFALPGLFQVLVRGKGMGPILALELPASSDEVEGILYPEGSETCRRCDWLRGQVTGDFLFITAYWLLFVGFSVLLARHRALPLATFLPPALAAVGIFSATGGALFDVLENLRLYAILETPPESGLFQQRVTDVYVASQWKWGLIFVATLAVAAAFFRRGRWITMATGAVYVSAAAAGLFGIVNDSREWVGRAFVLILAAVVMTALVLGWHRAAFEE